MDRAQFLRTGAATVAGAAASGVLAPAALAGLQPVAPAGDDVGFVQFGVLAERVGLTFYRRALKTPGLFGAAERRRLELARHAKPEHVKRLTAVLGEDAPTPADFDVTLPARAFRTRRGALSLGTGLEDLLVGVYLDGVAHATDPGTRLLLGRLLTSDAHLLAALRSMGGAPGGKGMPIPVDLEAAGPKLDALLKANGYPTV